MNSRYRFLIPNGITFLSLTCGFVSILSAASGNLSLAGWLIVASYILDTFDGALARRLNASSDFGLELDSLTDMVSLGAAPAVLAFQHLQSSTLPPALLWPMVVMLPLAGAFRLARFNLLPAKTDSSDSIGLTISTGGATIALAILTDLSVESGFLSEAFYIFLLPTICVLMVSTVRFPSLGWVINGRRRKVAVLTLLGASLFVWPFAQAWFLLTNGYLGVSLMRAGWLRGRSA
jgi:CDP-diacylglycerol--serine O-phosphatidyltransferase